MTEDYKERIIKYLTYNYTYEPPSTDPFFATNVEIKSLQQTISTYIVGRIGYIQGKDGKGNDLEIGFLYGNSNDEGVILIVDNEFNILQVIREYNTGTSFGKWICLNIDTTNGNIYGIDENNGNKRFLLLNNFLIKTPAQQDYEVKLRNSYILNLSQTYIGFVDKNPSSAFYMIIGNNNASPLISTYKIEVGAQNEFIDYPYQGVPTAGDINSYNIRWTGDDFNIVFATGVGGSDTIKEFYLDNNSQYITDYFTKTIWGSVNIGGLVVSNDYTYAVYKFNAHGANNGVKIIKFDDTIEEEIFYEEVEYDNKYNGKLFKRNNQVYAFVYIATNMPAEAANTLYKIEMGLIDSNDNFLYTTNTDLEINDIMSYIGFNIPLIFDVKTNYNLLTYNFITELTTRYLQAKQIYNVNNWNYTDYLAVNSTIPKSGILYDSSGNVIFARNLYNKTVNGNTTISSLEIPNMLLNDITIAQQDLLGETNGTLITNEDNIQKNIYEDVFINFINTITMQDRNTQDYVYNLNGATRLNASISNTADYTNATLNRIRINYTDNTSYVKSINPASRVSQFVYKYEFNVYVTKAISSIQLISNDTNTVYQTIDGSQFELNKAYKVSQDVEIQ